MNKIYQVEVKVTETHHMVIEADSVEEAKLLTENCAPDQVNDRSTLGDTDVNVVKITDITTIVRDEAEDYPDQVDPADEDHIYFNADPGENL